MELPPGLDMSTLYYIRVERADRIMGGVYWVSRYSRDKGWNISHLFADPFPRLTEVKKIMRQLKRRKGWEDAVFSIVAVERTPSAHVVFPVQVLDAIARL